MTCEQINVLSTQYLSGKLEAGQMSEFARHLASCADCDLDQRVRAAFVPEPVETALLERAIREKIQRRRVPRWAVAVAASLALAIAGGLSYRVFLRTQPPPICIAAARDHEREIVNGQLRPWLTDLPAIESLAEQQGVPASAIAALGTTGYRLDRARLCFLKKQIFLHLVYSHHGDQFSVYLRPRDAESSLGNSVHHAEVGSENLAYFQSDRLTAVFVAHESGANVLAFARAGAKVL